MLKEHGRPVIEEDPDFVILRMAREVANWFADYGSGRDREELYAEGVRYFRDVLELSEHPDLANVSDVEASLIRHGAEWVRLCCDGSDAVAAMLWLHILPKLQRKLGETQAHWLEKVSPMTLDMAQREYLLSVSSSEDAYHVWSNWGQLFATELEILTGLSLSVEIWDDDFGVWGGRAA